LDLGCGLVAFLSALGFAVAAFDLGFGAALDLLLSLFPFPLPPAAAPAPAFPLPFPLGLPAAAFFPPDPDLVTLSLILKCVVE
jgi:hypothetical protein